MSYANTGRVGWGIVGAGHIASVLAQDLALLPDEAELVGVGSRGLSKAETFADEYGVARAYGSYAELAADPDVDVVYVASTHNDHLASGRLCLEHGKAVLVEKPLTTSASDTAELLAYAAERDLFCMEALWTRTNPLVRKAAELVHSGELGPICHVAASFGFAFRGSENHRLLDPAQAGGAILDLGVYPVHLVNLFLGEPDGLEVVGWTGPTGVDVQATGLLRYDATDSRPSATASVICTLEASLPTRLEVFGERGSLTVDNFFLPPEMIVAREGQEPEVMVTQWPGRGYTFEAQEVMRCLRMGERESPLVPWADTLAVARTLDHWLAGIDPDRPRR